MNTETATPAKRGPVKTATGAQMEVLLLRGYVPKHPEIYSEGKVLTGQNPDGSRVYESRPATLVKLTKGEVHKLPEDEAKALMRKGCAVRPDEATEAQLIQAGIKAPPEPIEEDEEYDD